MAANVEKGEVGLGVSDPPSKERSPKILAVIPIKRLDEAKGRLAPLLTNNERKEFCLKMLEDVLRSVNLTKRISQTVIVGMDPEVRQVTKPLKTVFLEERNSGMNQAVSEAISWCTEKEATSVLILPADIPLITSTDLERILSLAKKASMVISPSRNGKGTNALLLTPPNISPTFFGTQSFRRHIEEAKKRKIRFSRLRSPRIAFDIDTVKDLKGFVLLNAKETSSYKLLDNLGLHKKMGIKSRKL